MSMSKMHKIVEKTDLLPAATYIKDRKKIRKDLVELKKNRRLQLGPYATFYFESFETMLGQIQEMLHIEKGGDEQLKDELAAYNPLIPKGNELVATLMFEIDNPITRADFLGKVGGIEEKVYLIVGGETIKSMPETDVDRTSAEGKASSVQFLHFTFTEMQIKNFKDLKTKAVIGIDHNLYNHKEKISDNIRLSLIKDFN
jgi:hypothetical protein